MLVFLSLYLMPDPDIQFNTIQEIWVMQQAQATPNQYWDRYILLGDPKYKVRKAQNAKMDLYPRFYFRSLLWALGDNDAEIRQRALNLLQKQYKCATCQGSGEVHATAFDRGEGVYTDSGWKYYCNVCGGNGYLMFLVDRDGNTWYSKRQEIDAGQFVPPPIPVGPAKPAPWIMNLQ